MSGLSHFLPQIIITNLGGLLCDSHQLCIILELFRHQFDFFIFFLLLFSIFLSNKNEIPKTEGFAFAFSQAALRLIPCCR